MEREVKQVDFCHQSYTWDWGQEHASKTKELHVHTMHVLKYKISVLQIFHVSIIHGRIFSFTAYAMFSYNK